MIDLKSYFHNKYQGGENFIENVILPIFHENKYEDAYEEDVLDNNPELLHMAETIGISQILRLGTINIPMNPTDIFDITVSNHVQMERNRVTIQQLVRRIMSTYSSAFMIFHYDDNERWDWRFTFCSKQGNNKETTDSKRYTFLLGPNQSCRTAAENFNKLAAKNGEIELDDIVKAFDVESLSKEFFEKYKVQYGRFVGHVIGKEYVDKGDGKGEWREKEGLTPSELFYGLHEDEKMARDYVKKLLGRIVFLHFLQKKGWLGATDEEWTNGPQDFMHQLFENASADQQENFLDDILEPLFSCLDTPLNQRREIFDTKVDGLRSVRVPFLGGLFERTDEDKALSIFPSELFADFFKFLSEYNFTIDENDPNDAQVGVDPEMLGRIFENLLEDNKDKGAFYTPKEIVKYMCRESLIAYLQTGVTDEPTREALRQFVTSHDVAMLGGCDSALAQNVCRCLKEVKICDPAIGSGAFPMGLLNELFLCRGVIEDFSNAADIKRHIIQQNIYGVDIEKGAVEIARLRFWLSLVTDTDKPDVLPNMDFKIMQGNSLLEQYKGFDLSHIMDTKTEILEGHQFNMFESQIDVIRAEVKDAIKRYYSEQNHDVRRAIRENIQQKIQQQIAVQGINVDISDIKDIAANDQFFLWHTWFSEVFEENGGFDIVIGNPPYGAFLTYETKDIYKRMYNDVHMRTPDTYNYFISKGIRLCNKQGLLSYIIPNTILSQNEYEKARLFLAEAHHLMKVINIGDNIFEDADVPTCIIFVGIDPLKDYAIEYADYKEIDNLEIVWGEGLINIPVSVLQDIPGHVIGISLGGGNLMNKISSSSIKIDNIAYEMAAGISTGCNHAFCLDQQQIIESSIESEILRPLIIGRDIDKYSIEWKNKYIIYTTKQTNIEKYPNAQKFALPYKDKLDKRRETKKGMIPWWALNWPRYEELFIGEKIIMRQTSDSIQATYDTENYYPLNSILTLRLNNDCGYSYKFILGILNCKLTNWVYQVISQEKGRAFAEVKPINVRKLYVPQVSQKDQTVFEALVDKILIAKRNNPSVDTSTLEAEIDNLVYQLYGLTEEEIKIVDPETPITREEYEKKD